MSVTISITGNVDYCRANGLNEVGADECYCVHNGEPSSVCPCCRGSGTMLLESFPFELNLANDNFSMLWKALGFPHDYSGSMSPVDILQAVEKVSMSELTREEKDYTYTSEGGSVRFIECGVTEEQVERYLTKLREIADEAIERKEQICWG